MMSYALGVRIRQFRDAQKVSQETMADFLGTTRQRYARMESGQIEISFQTIKKIADYLGVKVQEITSAVEERKGLTALFREKADKPEALKAVSKIENILAVFHSHEKLYYQMKAQDDLL